MLSPLHFLSLSLTFLPQVLERTGRLPGQKEQGFTTVGKAKMASKQYNSPMAMYSEDIIEEIMTQVCVGHTWQEVELRAN